MLFKNALLHFKTVCAHKYYVFKNCWVAGIPLQGLLHDLSKFSPTEFIESVRYFQGNDSPINACKKANGYSEAWLHHRGNNKHHYEYWVDNFDNGGKTLQMPYKYAVELICDNLAAGKTYNKKGFTYKGQYEWWLNRLERPIAMHPQTKLFVTLMLSMMADKESNYVLKPVYSQLIYKTASKRIKEIKNG